MSLVSQLQGLALRVSTESKALRTLINGNVANLSGLTTTAKANLVASINELVSDLDDVWAALATAGIDDSVTALTSSWSSSKVTDQLLALKNEILGGAGAAYDTLQELKTLLDTVDADSDSAIAAINTALANRVRTDINTQGLTSTQQGNARTNIDVYSKAEVGDITTDFVATFESGLV